MVNSNIKYRWDFLGLSTDNKPTPEESNKVVNGSTYYETDTSKLYVFYKDQWYERKPLGGGGGGGGGTDNYNNLSNLPKINGVELKGDKTSEDLNIDIPDISNFATKQELSSGLDSKQDTLVSGANIKTVNGNTLLGEGNIDVDSNVYQYSVDSTNPNLQPVSGQTNTYVMDIPDADWDAIWAAKNAGKIVVVRVEKLYDQINGDDGLVVPMVFGDPTTNPYGSGFGYYMEEPGGLSENRLVVVTLQKTSVAKLYLQYFTVGGDTVQTTEVYNEASTAADFNPVSAEYIKDEGVTCTKYRFYYRTSYLAVADSTKTFDFSALMANYTVKEWTNVSGFLDNGHKLSSGRTGNLGNVGIIQQIGRNSKQLIIRSYGDLSTRYAILQLEFYGTKN